jgi:hypothetical protein
MTTALSDHLRIINILSAIEVDVMHYQTKPRISQCGGQLLGT